MIHISKFGIKERIADANTVAKVGEIVKVRVYNVDKEKGRIGLEKILSEAEILAQTEKMKEVPKIEEK